MKEDSAVSLPQLDGIRAKLARARETTNALSGELSAFLKRRSQEIEVFGRSERGGREYSLIAKGDARVPARFAVMAGEVIHNLRSSLDHLVYALIEENGNRPSKTSQFPICRERSTFDDCCRRGYLKGMSKTARDKIESLQPFQSDPPDDTILFVVNAYDNSDKHRLLLLTTTMAEVGREIVLGTDPEVPVPASRQGRNPTVLGFGDPRPRELTSDGVAVFTVKYAEPTPEALVEANIVPSVVFQRCGRVDHVEVLHALRNFEAVIAHTLGTFNSEFQRRDANL